jgi:hypothetical protein
VLPDERPRFSLMLAFPASAFRLVAVQTESLVAGAILRIEHTAINIPLAFSVAVIQYVVNREHGYYD